MTGTGRITQDRLDRYAATLAVSGTELALRVPRIYGHARLSAASAATIGGIESYAPGRVLLVTCVGSDITLDHENTSANARARLDLPGDADVVLAAGDTATLLYDDDVASGVGRWRLVASSAGGGGGGGGTAPERFVRVLAANATGVNGTGTQPWFPTDGAVALTADKAYLVRGVLLLSTGSTSHQVRVLMGGTATYTAAQSVIGVKRASGNAGTTSQMAWRSDSGLITVTAGNTTAGAVLNYTIILRVTGAGTFIPQFQLSAAPGSVTIAAGTFIEIDELGDAAFDRVGTWS